jgi:hypothetical protein
MQRRKRKLRQVFRFFLHFLFPLKEQKKKKKPADDDENFLEHGSVPLSRESVDRSESVNVSLSGSIADQMLAPSVPSGKGQSIVLARTQASRSSLEMEDLFSEILRKTGAGEYVSFLLCVSNFSFSVWTTKVDGVSSSHRDVFWRNAVGASNSKSCDGDGAKFDHGRGSHESMCVE